MSNKNNIEQGKTLQLTDLLLMIVPSMFGLNTETNQDNAFQPKSIKGDEGEITMNRYERPRAGLTIALPRVKALLVVQFEDMIRAVAAATQRSKELAK